MEQFALQVFEVELYKSFIDKRKSANTILNVGIFFAHWNYITSNEYDIPNFWSKEENMH